MCSNHPHRVADSRWERDHAQAVGHPALGETGEEHEYTAECDTGFLVQDSQHRAGAPGVTVLHNAG